MSGSLRVLLIEDDEINRTLLAALLGKEGHQASTASSGDEALTLVGDRSFDVVLAALKPPGMNGGEIVRRIRESEKSTGRRVRILALTEIGDLKADERALPEGVDAVLRKPIQLGELLKALAAVPTHHPQTNDSPSLASIPHWDRGDLMRRINNNLPFLRHLLTLFRDDASTTLAAIQLSVQSRDFEQTAKLAHKLCGSAANLGGMRLEQAARRVHKSARKADPSCTLSSEMKCLEDEFKAFLSVIAEECEEGMR